MQAVGFPILGQALALRGRAHSATVSIAAGATNVCTVTIQVVDYDGNPVAGVHALEHWNSSAADGIALSTVAYSGTLVATSGAIKTALTAKHHFLINTDATGKFVGSLTDTAKTQGERMVVRVPGGSEIVVSAATVTASYG